MKDDQRYVVILQSSVRNSKFLNDDWMREHGFINEKFGNQSFENRTKKGFADMIVRDLKIAEYVAIDTKMACKEAIGLMKDKGFDQLLVTARPHYRLRGLVTMGNILSRMVSNHATSSTLVFYVMFHFSRGSEEFKRITECAPADKLTYFQISLQRNEIYALNSNT